MHLVNAEKFRGIPRPSGELKPICGKCMKGKQIKSSHKKVKEIRTIRSLDLLHMALMGPMQTKSRGGKRYVLVIVDDFLKYSFVSFLREKSKVVEHLKSLFNKIQLKIGHPIVRIRNDRGK